MMVANLENLIIPSLDLQGALFLIFCLIYKEFK